MNLDLHVLLVAAVATIVGWLWYSPILFGNAWMKLAGVSGQAKKASSNTMVRSLIVHFVANAVLVAVLQLFTDLYGARTFTEGAQVGFWIWLGFFATTLVGSVLWENKSWRLYLLNAAYYVVVLSLAGGLLIMWR